MRIGTFSKRVFVAAFATVTMFAGVPSSHAAAGSTAVCSAVGNRYADQAAVYDLNCNSGSADLLGNWHLNELDGNFTGTGPNGSYIESGVQMAGPICITVGGTYRYCKTIRVKVCIDSFCVYKTIIICVYYSIPRVTVCVEAQNRGTFAGDAVFTDEALATTATR